MRKAFAILLVILLVSFHLPAALADGAEEHTLIVATQGASTSDPRLEYSFFSRYPDGKIVYMDYGDNRSNSIQLLAGLSPDIVLFPAEWVLRYAKVDILEDLYEQVFPDGYPDTLAPQARHLMELDGKMIGVAEHWMTSNWSINKRYAEKLGYEIPGDGWTERELMDKYFDGYTGDTNGDGEQDVWFVRTGMVLDAEGVPVVKKVVYVGAYDAILNHANDLDYLLSEDFLAELELTKRLTNSEKIPTFIDDDGRFIPGMDVERELFTDYGGYGGPYRASGSSGVRVKIPCPAFLNGEPNCYVYAGYYCLMRAAPHHDLAVEVMRMMASEAYQSIFDGRDYGAGKCFGAKEPVMGITTLGAVNDWEHVAYSAEYHARVRIVDATALEKYRLTELTPKPEAYQAQLEMLAGVGNPFYDAFSLVEICEIVFWPAFKEYCEDNMTAEEVARLLYQRLRIAMYE